MAGVGDVQEADPPGHRVGVHEGAAVLADRGDLRDGPGRRVLAGRTVVEDRVGGGALEQARPPLLGLLGLLGLLTTMPLPVVRLLRPRGSRGHQAAGGHHQGGQRGAGSLALGGHLSSGPVHSVAERSQPRASAAGTTGERRAKPGSTAP